MKLLKAENSQKVRDDDGDSNESSSESGFDLNIWGANFPMRLPLFTKEGDIIIST